jgi:glycosyltransferase involved in cell wall biosynthesis
VNKPDQLLYFLSHPIQYFSPLFRALSRNTGLKVFYFADPRSKEDKGFGRKIAWDGNLLDGYDNAFLKNYSWHSGLNNRFFDTVNPGLFRVLWKEKAPIVIVNGWTYSSTLLTMFLARILGKKIWLRAENPMNQELRKSKTMLAIKRILLKHLLFRFFVDRFLYIGKENKAFFEYYGATAKNLIYTPYSVDNDFFSGAYELLRKDIPAVKRSLQLPLDRKIILFSGKYIAKKRPMDLLKAFSQLNKEQYALVMVGEGNLRGEMESYVQENQLAQVYLTGFINQSEIGKYYAVADLFVMCSGMGETWGLSVNEAMNFEKPLLISRTCGCCTDLLREGENGYSFAEGDVNDLAACISKILAHEGFAEAAGKKSKELVNEFSIGHIVEHLEDALIQ